MKKSTTTNNLNPENSIRLLPGVIIVLLQWICWLIVPYFVYGAIATAIMVFSSLLGGFALLIWWLFFSRSQRLDKLTALAIIAVSLLVLPQFSHDSIRTGMDGLMFFVYAVPSISLALLIWAVLSKRQRQKMRLVLMFTIVLLSSGIWLFVKSNGLSGHAKAEFAWRWNATINEKFLTQKGINSSILVNSIAEWPGFRGPNRDGIVKGTAIETDWAVSPPTELWRNPVGGGCSSFAVQGNYFYTQEQRDEFEIVSCYNILNGEPVWIHKDSAKFYDQHAGAGPRSTPTLHQGKVFTLGATGILNALNAGDGSVIWSTNSASDTDVKDSGWGFTCSPLVVNDKVIVAAAAKLIAYDINSGDKIWNCSDTTDSYSSAHLCTIDEHQQIIFMTGEGAAGINIEDGSNLWKHTWPFETRILQPAVLYDGELLINSGQKRGIRRLKVIKESGGWDTEEVWTSTRMRTEFNDFVIHKAHIFGFDGPNIVCINAENGERKWRGNRYGGQLILLADQDLLLILSEKGELALIETNPDKYTELCKLHAINGKTWNHPVLVNNILLVRNAKEMVAYQLGITG